MRNFRDIRSDFVISSFVHVVSERRGKKGGGSLSTSAEPVKTEFKTELLRDLGDKCEALARLEFHWHASGCLEDRTRKFSSGHVVSFNLQVDQVNA